MQKLRAITGRLLRAKAFYFLLMLASAGVYLAAGPLIMQYIFLPKASLDVRGGFSGVITDQQGQRRDQAIAEPADFRLGPQERRLQAWALFWAEEEGLYEFEIRCDDYASLYIDKNELIELPPNVSALHRGRAETSLTAGPHVLYVDLHNLEGAGWLEVQVEKAGAGLSLPLDFSLLNPLAHMSNFSAWWFWLSVIRGFSLALFLAGLLGLLLKLWRAAAGAKIPAANHAPDWVRTWISLAWISGGIILFWRYIAADASTDSALTGHMSFAVLKGLWPTFIGDMGFPGIVDAYIMAPLYALWGPSILLLNLLPVLFTLGAIIFLALLLAKLYNPAGFAAALTTLCFPPALVLYFAGEARMQYSISLFMGAWLMYFSVALLNREQGWGWRRPLAWGIIAGIMAWMHNGAISVPLACFVYLALMDWRRVLKALPWLMLGGLLCLAPFALFYLQYGPPPVMHGGFLIYERIWYLLVRGLPLLLGLEPGKHFAAIITSWHFLAYLLLAALFLAGLICLLSRVRFCRQRLALLPLLVMFFSALPPLLTGRPAFYVMDGRYHLLIWLGLPFVWGALAQRLSGLKLGAPLLALTLVALTIPAYFTYWNFDGHSSVRQLTGQGGPLLNIREGFYLKKEPQYQQRAADIQAFGLESAFVHDEMLVFYLGQTPWAASRRQPRHVFYNLSHLVVEGSVYPGYDKQYNEPARQWLGLPITRQSEELLVFEDLSWSAREIPLAGSRVYDLQGLALSPDLLDENLSTGFTGLARESDADLRPQGFVLELAQPEIVGRVSFIPFHSGWLPDYMRLEAAGEDGQFYPIRETYGLREPFYVSGPNPLNRPRFARLEACFAPRPIKYLRFSASSPIHPWSVREIKLAGPGPDNPDAAQWRQAADLLLAATADYKPDYVYADAWAGAIIRVKHRLSAPEVSRGEVVSKERDDLSSYHYPHWFEAAAGRALVVETRYAGQVRAMLERQGIAHEQRNLGLLTWLQILSPQVGLTLAPAQLKQSGQDLEIVPAQADSVQWINFDLGGHKEPPGGWPAEIAFIVPETGQTIKADLAGPLAFTGQMLLPAPHAQALYRLEQPVRASLLRLAGPPWSLGLDGQAEADWQVTLYAPAPAGILPITTPKSLQLFGDPGRGR